MGHLDSQRSLPAIGADKTGFSPLAKKLRLVAGSSVLVVNAPAGYAALLRPGPSDIATEAQPGRAYDAVLLFVQNVDELRQRGPAAINAARPNGLLWIAYPKGGAGRGALPFDYLEYLVSRLDVPLLYVPGNHDPSLRPPDTTWTPLRAIDLERPPPGPQGCVNIDGRLLQVRGLRIAGLGGSLRYKAG